VWKAGTTGASNKAGGGGTKKAAMTDGLKAYETQSDSSTC
jgi:hypothetical protein